MLPVEPGRASDIHYLARDFAGLRQAMLDRIRVLVPTWTETQRTRSRNHARRGAGQSAADRVSYLQDAINTEGASSPPHAAASRSAAMPGWWIIR